MSEEELLQRAREIVDQGWAQNGHTDWRGGSCIIGAFCLALGEPDGVEDRLDHEERAVLHRVSARLARELPEDFWAFAPPGARVAAWNDAGVRSLEDVASLLNKSLALQAATC